MILFKSLQEFGILKTVYTFRLLLDLEAGQIVPRPNSSQMLKRNEL